jgi:hypothetical protein
MSEGSEDNLISSFIVFNLGAYLLSIPSVVPAETIRVEKRYKFEADEPQTPASNIRRI